MTNKSEHFEMKVIDIFHLQGGHTVFAGIIENHEGLITCCEAKIIIDGTITQTICIDGEWMTERSPANKLRAISTQPNIDSERDAMVKKECRIRAT